jgi:hypothetical protein
MCELEIKQFLQKGKTMRALLMSLARKTSSTGENIMVGAGWGCIV